MLRVDMAYEMERVYVEIDGASVHASAAALHADNTRQNVLAALGWLPLRFTAAHLYRDAQGVIATVARTLDERRAAGF